MSQQLEQKSKSIVKVTISDSQGKCSSGKIYIQTWDKKERTLRALKWGGLCWVAGFCWVYSIL